MLIHELLNKDPDIVPEEAPLIVLYSNSDVFMDNNFKYIYNTTHIFRRVHFVMNGENWKIHKIDYCEVGLQLEEISTKNVGENDLNTRIKYIMVILDNWYIALVQDYWQNIGESMEK